MDSPITRNDVKSSGDNGSSGSRRCRDTCSLLIGPRRFYPSGGPPRDEGKSRRNEGERGNGTTMKKWRRGGRPMAPVTGKYGFFNGPLKTITETAASLPSSLFVARFASYRGGDPGTISRSGATDRRNNIRAPPLESITLTNWPRI